MGLFGPPNVEKMEAKKDIKGLINALGYQKDNDVRQAAAAALVRIGATAVEPLSASLKHEYGDVRRAAAKALGEIGDPRAVEPLLAAVKAGTTDSMRDGSSLAVEALAKIGTPAIDIMVAALRDVEWKVRRAAVLALSEIGDPRAIQPLIATLMDKDDDVRRAVAGALVKAGEPAVRPLIVVLEDLNVDARRSAVEALGEIGDPQAVRPLVAVLNDEDQQVRQAAADALVKVGKPAVQPLIAVLEDLNVDVRRAAAESLGEIGDPQAVRPLVAALNDEDQQVRKAAANALVKVGEQSVDLLTSALQDPEGNVRNVAAGILEQLGWKPDCGESGAWYWVIKRDCKQASKLGLVAVTPLLFALHDEDKDVRMAAAEALGRLGWQPDQGSNGAAYWISQGQWERCIKIGEPAIEPLTVALKDESKDRRQAAAALGQIGDASALKPLIAALKDFPGDLRSAAAEALGLIGDTRAVQPLIDALKDNDIEVRLAVAKALGLIGDARAVAPLIPLLESSSSDMRESAAEALVALYQSGRLDEKHQRLIIAERSAITSKRVNESGHYDISRPGASSDCHVDDHSHQDTGIGVDFPV